MPKETKLSQDVIDRAKKIKLLLMDCDGVLTDGRLYFSASGEELKVFNVKDGQGIVSWHQAGFRSGIISGRESTIVNKRATELGITYIRQGSTDKTKCFSDILNKECVSEEEVAFIGDDIGDVELLKIVGFPVAVADAVEQILPLTVYKTEAKGGYGAVRELIDLLLRYRS